MEANKFFIQYIKGNLAKRLFVSNFKNNKMLIKIYIFNKLKSKQSNKIAIVCCDRKYITFECKIRIIYSTNKNFMF